MNEPREIDGPLVDAYLARRALDYLVGFTLSPVLWRKLPGARSAGRVQSVALRLVCDREVEIEAFKQRGILDDRSADSRRPRARTFHARLIAIDGKTLEEVRHQGRSRPADAIKAAIEDGDFTVVVRREEGREAQSRRPLHHLDPAAGGLAQARLLGQAHHAGRPAPL